mgnify:CR=1 FL=1
MAAAANAQGPSQKQAGALEGLRVLDIATFIAALVVFAVVQDRVTASGARRYVAASRASLAGGGAPVTIDQIVAPAVRRSVIDAAMWAGVVGGVGVLASWFLVPGSRSGSVQSSGSGSGVRGSDL